MFKKTLLFLITATIASSVFARLPEEIDDGLPYKQRREPDLTLRKQTAEAIILNHRLEIKPLPPVRFSRKVEIDPVLHGRYGEMIMHTAGERSISQTMKLLDAVADAAAKTQRQGKSAKTQRNCFALTINRDETVRTGQIQYNFADTSEQCLAEQKANDEYAAIETRRLLERSNIPMAEHIIYNAIRAGGYLPHVKTIILERELAEHGSSSSEIILMFEEAMSRLEARRRARQALEAGEEIQK